ncbi:Formyltransferase [Fomitiporia mediterranea MF3/22]|uniref:methionyl-tRNA formyltransferase n=1 Tax=Fomitiporia mediterranea (strain MF3/22) TaxID=694068 RepID=R7SHL1_FOMME|nr:Formyltransferase [Fomitiporia mediterranea MF3/22]EJC97747.1 Formyltransferase [Fomitiporia mediterranea MF3/22]
MLLRAFLSQRVTRHKEHRYWQHSLRNLTSVATSGPFSILFLGRDEFSVLVLDQLHKHQDVWNDIAIATLPDEKTGRNGSKISISPLKLRSLELGLETHLIPRKKAAFKDWSVIQPPSQFFRVPPLPNQLLVTASFGRMIPDRILHLFPVSRRLNVHPSLIPFYRGPAPIQHTIADGRSETGVCVLEMKEKRFGADVGEIWAKKSLDVQSGVTFSALRDKLAIEGGKLLVSVLKNMIAGTLIATPQDDANASYAPFTTQETATVDFHSWDALKVERMYRAIGHQKPIVTTLPSLKTLQLHAPQPFVQPTSDAEPPKPLRALHTPGDTTFDPTTRKLAIRCANGTFLYVPVVKQQDKKLLSAEDWWKGVWPEWLNNKVMKLGYGSRAA